MGGGTQGGGHPGGGHHRGRLRTWGEGIPAQITGVGEGTGGMGESVEKATREKDRAARGGCGLCRGRRGQGRRRFQVTREMRGEYEGNKVEAKSEG